MDPVIGILLFGAGAAAGAIVAVLVCASRARAARAELAAEARAQTAAAESAAGELRRLAAERETALEALRRDFQAERDRHVADEARLVELQARLGEQAALLERAQAKLADTFKALSADALKSNNQAFIDLARQVFESTLTDAKGDALRRQEAIDAIFRPLQESLRRYDEQLQAIEKSRATAYGTLEGHLKSLGEAQAQLRQQTGELATALRAPNVQGRWGEMQLRRVVELSGMEAHCDFTEQASHSGEDGIQRPDLVVHLAGGRKIVVDAKSPLNHYLDAVACPTEEARREALKLHARAVRGHMEALAKKSYWEQFEGTPECVVLFVPGESFLAAALAADRTLLEDALNRRVLLASATNLMAILLAVVQGWRQAAVEENAEKISALGRELHDRLRVLAGHFQALGKSLSGATDAYNKAMGSFESRVLAKARRFQELGAAGGAEIPEVESVDASPRLPDGAGAGDA